MAIGRFLYPKSGDGWIEFCSTILRDVPGPGLIADLAERRAILIDKTQAGRGIHLTKSNSILVPLATGNIVSLYVNKSKPSKEWIACQLAAIFKKPQGPESTGEDLIVVSLWHLVYTNTGPLQFDELPEQVLHRCSEAHQRFA